MGLTYSSVVDASLEEVSAWHARPGAVTRLVPPWPPARALASLRRTSHASVSQGQAPPPPLK